MLSGEEESNFKYHVPGEWARKSVVHFKPEREGELFFSVLKIKWHQKKPSLKKWKKQLF